MRKFGAGLVAFLACALSLSSVARAEPDPQTRAAAVALFDEGRKLLAEGRYAEACVKLEQSQKMDPGPGALFNLSDCYEHIGRTASAWVGFREVLAQARASKREDRETLARERVEKLEGRLTRIVVEVDAAAPADLEVRRNDVVLSKEIWGAKVPVDPGKMVFRATAPGYEAWESTLDVSGEGNVVTVRVPALKRSATAAGALAATPPPPGPAGTTPTPPPSAPQEPPKESSMRGPLGLVLAGVGVIGMGVGGVLGFSAKSTFDDSDPHCDDAGKCDQDGVDLRDDAVSRGNLATLVFAGGGVLAAAGVVLFVTAPSDDPATTTGLVRVKVGPSAAYLEGAF